MERNPCEGRNVEDSEEDLYSEYHGFQGNQSHDHSITQLDLYTEAADMQDPRQRTVEDGEAKMKQEIVTDRFEGIPSLQSTIDTNFTAQIKSRCPDGHLVKKEVPDTFYAENGMETQGEDIGYNFLGRFGEVYREHERQLVERRSNEARERSAQASRAMRSKSWSEGLL